MEILPKAEIIVSRHAAFVQRVIELGFATEETPVLKHVENPEQIIEKVVVGMLPMWLAHKALCVINIDIKTPKGKRADELTIEELRELATTWGCYMIRQVADGKIV